MKHNKLIFDDRTARQLPTFAKKA